MKIIWVLENIQEDKDFYGKLNILLLLASVRLWKKHNPTDVCVLYCDSMTEEVITSLKVNHFWDEIKQYRHTRNIDRSVFWAASKLGVLSEQNEPCIIMDNDTLCFSPLKPHLDLSKVYVCNFEYGKGYYPTSYDERIRKLSYKTRWKTQSVNVSFLNLPNPSFTQMYAKMSLDMMEELTELDAPNSQYLIFAEQLLLKHLLDRENIQHRSILSTYWDCKNWDWAEDHDKGIWNINESHKYFKHYGPLKTWILGSIGDQNYDREVSMLYNCINFRNLDLTSITNK